MAHNGRLAADVQGLLGLLFVFVFSSFPFLIACFESLGLHGLGCKLVVTGC
jgi:hypothetical protein